MFSCNIKKIPTWDLTTLLKVEVVKYSELSTLLLLNFIAIFGVFVGAQHLIKLFLRLLNCLMTSSILKGGLRMSLVSLMSSDRFSLVGLLQFFSCKLLLAEPSDHLSTLLTVCLGVMAIG